MTDWESEREKLLGAVALYADEMSQDRMGDYAKRVDEHVDYLDRLMNAFAGYANASPAHGDEPAYAGEPEAALVFELLKRLDSAARNRDNEILKAVLTELMVAFPIQDHPVSSRSLGDALVQGRGEKS